MKLSDADVERLAIVLFKKMEHLDPTEDGTVEDEDWGWARMTERRKDFYRLCVKELAWKWND